VRTSWDVAVASCALLLSGCAGVPVANTIENTSVQGAALQGRVHGGQQPISGAHVYLYAINNTGYGSPSLSLLTSATGNPPDGNDNYYVTTDSGGNFTITGDYNCFSATPLTYVYAVGGNPGLASGTNNTAAGLLAGVGDCTHSDYTSKYVLVNEVSTIASVYGVAGYVVDPTHVSTSSSTLGATGLENAADTVGNLYTQSTGVALATTPTENGGNGTVPQAEINTLANILAACINTNGAVTGGASPTPCYTLFTNALSGGTTGTQPADTATAAINIAHNPWANIANLFGLQTGTSPFQPMLSAAPNDFTIAISYTGGGLGAPADVAIDGSGNVWATNDAGGYTGYGSISEFDSTGWPLSGSSGYSFSNGDTVNEPQGLAVDSSGNVWEANYLQYTNGLWSIIEVSPTGSKVSKADGSYYINIPFAIALDASGDVWVTDLGSLADSGSPGGIGEWSASANSGSGEWLSTITTGGVDDPYSIAIDVSGNVWVANYSGNSISGFNSSGAPYPGSPLTGGGLAGPYAIAIDGAGNVWVGNDGINSLSKYSPSTSTWITGSSGFTGGGLDNLNGIAIDGSGNVWIVNYSGNSISEFNSGGAPITGSNGYIGGGMAGPYAIAIDGSGNVWVTNPGGGDEGDLVEFVGVATPVVTPTVANLISPYGSHAVNKP